ncbi:hypothetical protein OHB26_13375 [Nocardia sp. NBC_01503]|uniref:hypothetical protein n=1 Tax=Nocardia sp. NBC_01503 TaxID=2975997 RepID=UPI002E7BE74C|nr:hypothetical protein [Nocardia sp. NBC_01503]WTL35092.1 hypothetical protein OHB26_13375 [Nocardia sp. NBC_01503]
MAAADVLHTGRAAFDAAIASLPEWMRRTGGFDQPGLLDAVYPPAVRAAMTALSNERLEYRVAKNFIGPMTGRLLREHLRAGVPANPMTVTPQQARTRYGHAARRGA